MLEVVRMAHRCRPPIANGCVVGSKSTIGLIRGETLWVGARTSGDRGGRARVWQHHDSGVVSVARGGIPVRLACPHTTPGPEAPLGSTVDRDGTVLASGINAKMP